MLDVVMPKIAATDGSPTYDVIAFFELGQSHICLVLVYEK